MTNANEQIQELLDKQRFYLTETPRELYVFQGILRGHQAGQEFRFKLKIHDYSGSEERKISTSDVLLGMHDLIRLKPILSTDLEATLSEFEVEIPVSQE